MYGVKIYKFLIIEILIEQAHDELKKICTKFLDESEATDMEVKTLLRELARVY